jgi:hypothetical protein
VGSQWEIIGQRFILDASPTPRPSWFMPTRSSPTRSSKDARLTESTQLTIAESRAVAEKTKRFIAKSHDFAAVARRVVEQAIDEHLNLEPLADPNEGKNPAAIARGRLGGIKGVKARAEALSERQRVASAKKAARTSSGTPSVSSQR